MNLGARIGRVMLAISAHSALLLLAIALIAGAIYFLWSGPTWLGLSCLAGLLCWFWLGSRGGGKEPPVIL